jgi:DNA repair exonuclease SbcCD nuclease subunit
VPVAKLIQISDLHLGVPCAWLPAGPREERRRERQRALEQCVEQAIERQADAIILPGDLFDREGPDAETIAFALHA